MIEHHASSAGFHLCGMPGKYLLEDLTRAVIAAFYEVYTHLGYGFLESVYVETLARELTERGHKVSREVAVQIYYKGLELKRQRIDLVADEVLIVEVKASYEVPSGSRRQLYNYLRGTNLEVGLLLHFGVVPKVYREIGSNDRKLRRVQ